MVCRAEGPWFVGAGRRLRVSKKHEGGHKLQLIKPHIENSATHTSHALCLTAQRQPGRLDQRGRLLLPRRGDCIRWRGSDAAGGHWARRKRDQCIHTHQPRPVPHRATPAGQARPARTPAPAAQGRLLSVAGQRNTLPILGLGTRLLVSLEIGFEPAEKRGREVL